MSIPFFGSLIRSMVRRYTLAKWMVDPDGLAMQYDIDANFSPVQAYAQKRANCLSFTLLLRALVAELGIEIQINEVDIPAN